MAIDNQLFLDFQIPEVLLWRRLLDRPERPRDDDRLREDGAAMGPSAIDPAP